MKKNALLYWENGKSKKKWQKSKYEKDKYMGNVKKLLWNYVLLIKDSYVRDSLGNFREFDVSSKNRKNSENSTSFPRISGLPRSWRHFLEEFFDRPPTVSCSPNTKWNFWTEIGRGFSVLIFLFEYLVYYS